jgi:hypothetical protein
MQPVALSGLGKQRGLDPPSLFEIHSVHITKVAVLLSQLSSATSLTGFGVVRVEPQKHVPPVKRAVCDGPRWAFSVERPTAPTKGGVCLDREGQTAML